MILINILKIYKSFCYFTFINCSIIKTFIKKIKCYKNQIPDSVNTLRS